MSRTSEAANDEAVQYLSTLLNRTLHIHIADGRMFEGTMKCTDKVCNHARLLRQAAAGPRVPAAAPD